jgi:4-methylaminobutanoate oxidase (formaldehyde-forming)
LWGPNARDVLQAVTPTDVSNEAFPYMTAQTVLIGQNEVWAQRVTYVGELGWELYIHRDHADEVWDILMKAGQPFGLIPAGYKSLDSLRLEKAYRYWSSDITPVENPYEAGLSFCVKLKKGNFVGREALGKIKAEGLKRRLCTTTIDLPLDSAGIIYGGEATFANGQIVGRLRSGGYGYTVGKWIGFLYLPLNIAKEGTPLEIEVFGQRVPAVVTADVLYDPKGERVRL